MTVSTLTSTFYVEDEPDVQEVAKIALEMLGGYTLKVCSSGDEAIAAVETFTPVRILLDVMMPAVFMTAKVMAKRIGDIWEANHDR
jgi:CheY-like chemotaxis protein